MDEFIFLDNCLDWTFLDFWVFCYFSILGVMNYSIIHKSLHHITLLGWVVEIMSSFSQNFVGNNSKQLLWRSVFIFFISQYWNSCNILMHIFDPSILNSFAESLTEKFFICGSMNWSIIHIENLKYHLSRKW